MPWQNWCVWAKYRTIVPKLGTPGERAAASRQLGSWRERTIAEICQFHPELPACRAGKPERTIIRLPGSPSLQHEQKNQSVKLWLLSEVLPPF